MFSGYAIEAYIFLQKETLLKQLQTNATDLQTVAMEMNLLEQSEEQDYEL